MVVQQGNAFEAYVCLFRERSKDVPYPSLSQRLS